VRDQTSPHAAARATLPADTTTDSVPTAPLAGALRCMVCGRESAWLLPPPWLNIAKPPHMTLPGSMEPKPFTIDLANNSNGNGQGE
jgi:hypothetical protein